MSFLNLPTVPSGKQDLKPVPAGQTLFYLAAAEWNAICQDLLDLRANAVAGFIGLADLGAAPTTNAYAGLGPAVIWGRGDGRPVYTRSGVDQALAFLSDVSGAGGALPGQGGHAGQFLETDGMAAQWLPIVQVPSGADGQFLGHVSGNPAYVTLNQDMIAPAWTITGFSDNKPTVLEVGDSFANPVFTISYNRPAAAAQITDGVNPPLVLVLPFTSGTEPHSYTSVVINHTQTFTLAANELGGPTKNASYTHTWEPRVYWDVQAPPGMFNAAFITGLANSQLQAAFATTIAFGAGGGTKKLYYAFPTAFGAPSSFKDTGTGFAVPFSKVAAAVNVTNGFGVVIAYDVWGSDNFLNNAVTVQVS